MWWSSHTLPSIAARSLLPHLHRTRSLSPIHPSAQEIPVIGRIRLQEPSSVSESKDEQRREEKDTPMSIAPVPLAFATHSISSHFRRAFWLNASGVTTYMAQSRRVRKEEENIPTPVSTCPYSCSRSSVPSCYSQL